MMMMAIQNPKVDIDLFFSKNLLLHHQQVVPRLQLAPSNFYLVRRREFSVFNDLSKKIKVGETQRTNQTTEQLNKIVNAVWTEFEAEAKAKKGKDSFGMRNQESTLSNGTSGKDGSKSPLSKMWDAFKNKFAASRNKLPLSCYPPPGYIPAFHVFGDDDMAILYGEMQRRNPTKTLSRADYFILGVVQNVVKQVLIADFNITADIKKFPGYILDLIVLGEPDLLMLYKEMRRRNPTFSKPEFHKEVEKVVKPVLNAHFKKQGVGATKVG